MDGDIYLDHAGTALPTETLLNEIYSELLASPISNPHSSIKCRRQIDAARNATLEFFNTNSNEYSVVFTAGATASIKTIGELFPWSSESCYFYPMNSHTSLLGLRSYSPTSRCFPSKCYYDVEELKRTLDSAISELPPKSNSSTSFHLLATIGECNFSGAKCSLPSTTTDCNSFTEILSERRQAITENNTSSKCIWLLDAAKLVSTSPLDLSIESMGIDSRPHFVVLSYYKIFGYPTGLGALLVRNDCIPLLSPKRYYGGGTILAAAADTQFIVPHPLTTTSTSTSTSTSTLSRTSLHKALEDGTPHFQGILGE
eukprot:gene6196-12554_t